MHRTLMTLLLSGLLAGCTPQQQLLMALVPEGAASVLLSHLSRVPEANRTRIVEFEAKGDWEGLVRFAEENIAKDRSSADWWFVAGYAHTQLRRHARAAECFAEMVRLDPQDPEGWHGLAQAYRADQRPERAIRVLDQFVLVGRGTALAYHLLGESYSDLRRWNEAAGAYRDALNLDGRLAQSWFGLGRAEARLGRIRQAREALAVLERSAPPLAAGLALEIQASSR